MLIYSPWGSLAIGRTNRFGDKQLGNSHFHIIYLTDFSYLYSTLNPQPIVFFEVGDCKMPTKKLLLELIYYTLTSPHNAT